MAENHLTSTVEAMFQGMDHFVSSKTVVGEAVTVGDTIILPLIDVACGMAAGAFQQPSKQNGAGGMSAKMSPTAVLVIQNGVTKLISIKHQDPMTKIIDLVPDLVNRFAGGGISDEAMQEADRMAEELSGQEKTVREDPE